MEQRSRELPIRRRKPRVAELVGLVSGERLGWLAESCGPLPDLGAAAEHEIGVDAGGRCGHNLSTS